MSSKERARDINLGVIRITKWYNGPKGEKRSKEEGAWSFQYLKIGESRLSLLARARWRNLKGERKPEKCDANANRRKILQEAGIVNHARW